MEAMNAFGSQKTASTDLRTNWAGNYTYGASRVVSPTTVEALQELVASSPRLKVMGSRHSFNGVADTDGPHISLEDFAGVELDEATRTVHVGGGVRYGGLAAWLDRQGYALHNLASLPHISVAGACATGTHGSGLTNGSLSTAVSAIEFVAGTGELVRLTRASDGELFSGAVVSLGALGLVTRLSLDVQPTFQIGQAVYENLSFDRLERSLPEIFASGYSVSLFTDWQGQRATQAWVKRRAGSDAPALSFFGATLQQEALHPLPDHSAVNCTQQLGIPGPWHERLPHFRMEFTPSSGSELQSEFFVPLEDGYEAILAVEQLRPFINPYLYISELRTVAADDLWLSMAYQRESLAIHFTWKQDWAAVRQILPLIEARLAPFGARPHWAKLFDAGEIDFPSLYPRFRDFRELCARYDPEGKFRNPYLDALFPIGPTRR
jgi:xylitol oxidase